MSETDRRDESGLKLYWETGLLVNPPGETDRRDESGLKHFAELLPGRQLTCVRRIAAMKAD